jgi:predicted TIM-barrel fold metal-dependent hydrolase
MPLPKTLTAAALLFMAALPSAGADAAGLRGADHHMHMRSSENSALWMAICTKMPDACPPDLPMPPSVNSADEAVAALDAAGLEKGVVLSLAYFYGMPEMADSEFNRADFARRENAFVAEQVSRYPDRLVGFFSVNPLMDYALDEVRYQAELGKLGGLKLHFANSAVDLADPEHIRKLKAIFAVINEHRLPIVVHVRNRSPEYGAEAVKVFIDEVLVPAPNVTLQLAHLGGWGGFDPATDGAIQAFLDAFADGRLDRSRVWFETSAVIAPNIPEPARVKDETLPEIATRLREIGLDRIVFGTDWDVLGSPAQNIEMLRSRLPLTDAEWQQLLSNQAPYLKPRMR